MTRPGGHPNRFASFTQDLRRSQERLGDTPGDHLLTIAEQIDAIGRGDFEAALHQANPDLELEIFAPMEFPFIRRARGLEDVRRAIEHNFAALEGQQPVIGNVMGQGDVVVLIGSERGRIRSTGASYHVQSVHRFTFVDGALAHIQIIAARVVEEAS
jgi:ketosteroid isomerase-like protein